MLSVISNKIYFKLSNLIKVSNKLLNYKSINLKQETYIIILTMICEIRW